MHSQRFGGKANDTLEAQGIALIGRVTFHSFRRSYTSLRCVCGDDVRYVSGQLGHEDEVGWASEMVALKHPS